MPVNKNPVIRLECSFELLQELIDAQRALERSVAKRPGVVLHGGLAKLIVKVASAVPLLSPTDAAS